MNRVSSLQHTVAKRRRYSLHRFARAPSTMKIYYAKPSPYARRVRVLLRERGLLSQIDEIAIAPWDSPAELLAVNPTSKVPALVLDDGTTLTESALIATHLDGMGDAEPLLPGAAMTRLLHAWGLAEGLTAAAWLVVVEARRDEAQRSPAWLARQRDAIDRCLVALEAVAPLPPAPSYSHIVLGVALGYLDFRLSSIDWRSSQPRLTQWYATFAQRDAMRATAPD
jgi:glutathione S-transferase